MLANQLLAVKLTPPPLRPGRVMRPRLSQKLEQAFTAHSRLTLICAPAGYGKTTLAVEWLQQDHPGGFCWLTLDQSDNDPQRFFSGLVGAVRQIEPAFGGSTTSLMSISPQPPVEGFAAEFIAEISALERAVLLVLDDYHHIHARSIHDAMETLLAYQPPNLHLLITSREDPPFPLARIRAAGQLVEARLRDLSFTAEEVRAFLSQAHQLNLSPQVVDRLLEITEGWAAGIQLTGLAFQNEQDAEALLETFSGTHQYIIEYLMEEVLRRQPPEIRRFLTCTSILERFNAGLCAALFEADGISASGFDSASVRQVIAALEHANLFLTPLDATREWYRYHRLFADVLRSGLDPALETALRLRAARWFHQHDLPGEAIPHYLAAGATHEAGRLVRGLAAGLVKNGELQTLLGWLQALPAAEVRSDPQLLASHALALLLTGQISLAAAMLEGAIPAADHPAGSGSLLAVKAWLGLVCGGSAGLRDLAMQALAELPSEETIFRALALLSLGTGFQLSHNLGASSEAFQEAYALGLKMEHPFAALAGLTNLVFNLLDMGQLRKARALCLDALPRYVDPRGNPLPLQGMIAVPLAAISLEQNNLDQARHYAELGRDMCQKMFSSGMMGGDAEVVLAMVAFLEGDRETAFAIAGDLYRFAAERRVAFLKDKMTALQAELYLRSGDLEGARGCLARLEIQDRALIPTGPQFIVVLKAQLQAAEGRLVEALDALAPVEQDYRKEERIRSLIGLLAIKTGMLFRLGRRAAALENLSEAVRLAAPEGFYRALLRCASDFAALLPEVREVAPAYIDALIAALPPSGQPLPAAARAPAPSALAEPLSEQEQKVLRLLAAGLSNQDIADRLYITSGTAKWHVHNILAKLGATSRSQAAAIAREQGLL